MLPSGRGVSGLTQIFIPLFMYHSVVVCVHLVDVSSLTQFGEKRNVFLASRSFFPEFL